MRFRILSLIGVIFVFCSGPASSDFAAAGTGQDTWSTIIYVTHLVEGWGSYAICGVAPDAADGYDGWDSLAATPWMTRVGTYHSPEGENWLGPAGYYPGDFRAPLAAYGASHTWRIWLWNTPSLPLESLEQRVLVLGDPVPSHLVTLTLAAKPEGVTGGPPVGTTWELVGWPRVEFYLPTFRTTDGQQGYLLELTATVVPEPSSLFALTGGIGLLAGVIRRRRT